MCHLVKPSCWKLPVFAIALWVQAATGLWATITPVVRPDRSSAGLTPAFEGRALGMYNEAINYLEQVPLAAQVITWLQRSSVNYKVELVDADNPDASSAPNEFNPAHNVLRWEPQTALEWKGSFYSHHAHSAAIGLLHELGHAYHKDVNAAEFFRSSRSNFQGEWDNPEEKRTILEIENPVAKALGESERFFHDSMGFYGAKRFAAVTPTSIQPAQKPAIFTPVPGRDCSQDERLGRLLNERIRSSPGRRHAEPARAG